MENDLLKKYPKKRIKLPDSFQKIYSKHYKQNREGGTIATSIVQKMEAWLHKKVASDVKTNKNKLTLEIGAGTLNHLKYEQTQSYDIVEPFEELYINSQYLNRVNRIYANIDEISHSNKYDRIISVATLEHIIDLPKEVAITCLLLNETGLFRVAIPNEGTFLWKLGWKMITGVEFKLKYGLDYEILMKHEHVNTAKEIEEILKYFYGKVKVSYFGISKKIAFYVFFKCALPNIERANNYLKNIHL